MSTDKFTLPNISFPMQHLYVIVYLHLFSDALTIKGGLTGRVIDTLRNLYSKTHYRVKRGGKLSPAIESLTGVNQGGAASGILFRKYLQDLNEYLKKDAGVCIGETLVAHLLWADDLVLFSNTEKGIQKQLNGLKRFCARNKMIANEAKTKLMIFG